MEHTLIKKKKKPKFIRQQARILKKLSRKGWRAPKGMHSKLRKKKKGKGPFPSLGYASPKELKGLTKKGLIPILVSEASQLKNLTNKHGLIVLRALGTKKKLDLLKKIKEAKLHVLNIKNIDEYINQIEEKIKLNKEAKQKTQEKKKKSKEEALKKAEAEKSKEETPEEKEKREKEEKRKVLEQK